MNILDFKHAATQHNVCNEYYTKWNSCTTDKELIDLALSAQGIEFIAPSFAQGWNIDTSIITMRFHPYINGRYISRNKEGYTSALICDNQDEMTAEATNLLVIDSECVINIPVGHCSHIFVTGNSDIVVFNEGYANIMTYGKAKTTVKGNGKFHTKHIE